MGIWFKPYRIEELLGFVDRYLIGHIGIELTELGEDHLTGKMPVDDRTRMPLGLLHGGASCVLAESLASIASFLCVDPAAHRVVGLEINANHIRGIADGFVWGTCRPLHLGRRNHVWDIRITNEADNLICVSRMTMAVLPRSRD